MKQLSFGLLFCLLLAILPQACNNASGEEEEKVEEIPTNGKIADIYRNPISLDTPEDTVNVAKLVFEESFFDFGEIPQGEVVYHKFKFKNTGNKPLLISNARSTCGCTIPKWPKEVIEPGTSGVVDVKFDSKGKLNKISKPITISANTFPAETKIYMRGIVLKK